MINENCPCKKIECPRHGNCEECRKHHHAKDHLTNCEKIAEEERKKKTITSNTID